MFLPTTYHLPPTFRRGQAALSLVFLIGGIALLVSITLSLVAINFLNSTFAFQSANKAMAEAMGGASDAILQLIRNPQFASGGYQVCLDFTNCTANSANVTVTQGSGQATIVSTATVSASQRKIQAVASIDPATGKINVASLTILTI
jgi:hypothetical protein